MLLLSVGQPVFSEDTWLRLSLGEAYATAGPWLVTDPLLHTATGPPAPAAWLSDIALYGIKSSFGFSGLRVVHVLGVVAILVLAWSLLRRVSTSPLFASLGTGLFAVLSAYRLFQLRPHLVSIGVALLLVRILVSDKQPPSWRRILIAVGLFALWANAHAAFVLGPVLIGAAAIGAGIAAWTRADATARTRAARIALALVLGLLATLLNPEGFAPHLLYLGAGVETPALEVVVDEWLSLSLFQLPPANLPPSLLCWVVVWGLVVLTPWAAIRQLRADGQAFIPMVWSQEGRPHPTVERVMAYAAQVAARGRPGLQPKQFVRRWRREITIELQRSLARMIMVCEPAQGRRADFFLGGRLDVEGA